MSRLRRIVRSDERRVVLGAFLTLLMMMSAHALLETARDALFLARIPASRLPWVYLVIAGFSLAATEAQRRLRGAESWRGAVVRWLLFGAAVTFGFWLVVPRAGPWVLYALYVWSGVLATLLVVRFWQLIGDLFTASQAKRLFALIGTGSVLGAILGSGLAGVMATVIAPEHLILAAAIALAAGAAAPLLLLPDPTGDSDVDTGPVAGDRRGFLESLRVVVSRPYTARLAGLVLVATIGLTIADYLFKATVAAHVDPAELGTFFATVYFALNVVSLLVQVLLVGWLVRRLSITVSLAVLPIVLLVGAAGFIVAGGLIAALVLKAADGSLKHSLHRTVTELLFVPMTEKLRSLVKALIDVAGQRGGQAIASLTILGLVALGASDQVFGLVLAGLLLFWIALALGLRPHYLNLFRDTLESTLIQTRIDFPELDMGSLESLIASLNSEDDDKVVAALELLSAEDKARLIPALILYHPSDGVVVRALELFAHAQRSDFVPIARRLFDTRAPAVRSAIVRALAAVTDDVEFLREQLASDCWLVRATAAVSLMARGDVEATEVEAVVEALFERAFPPALQAAAQAVQHLHDRELPPAIEALLVRLARHPELAVKQSAVVAIAEHPSELYLPVLLELSARRELRHAARRAILGVGDAGLAFCETALRDASVHFRVRRHLPRAISQFGSERAANSLLAHLPDEPDGMVRFKIIRALQLMRLSNPRLDLESPALDAAIEVTVRHLCQLIDWRATLEGDEQNHPERATRVKALLSQMLRDKESNALDRLFRVLALRYPAREIREISRGLLSASPALRSSSQELLESLLPNPLRDAVVGLIDDLPDRDRLASAAHYHKPAEQSYEMVLRRLLESSSESLRSLAVYHIGELGLKVMRADLDAMTVHDSSYLNTIVSRVKDTLMAEPGPDLAFES